MTLPFTPLLSICIPTYNFGAFIGETLDSIILDCPPGVEIVVLDGGSTDDTGAVVVERQENFAGLAYHRLPARGGIDHDMAAVVDLASGPYCWLFSADDVMMPGAVRRVMREIESGADVYILTHADSYLNLEIFCSAHPIIAVAEDRTFDLGNPVDRAEYFALAKTTEAFFSFMSGLCIKTATWRSVPIDERFVGSCWAHVARLLSFVSKGLSVRVITTTLLNRRGENDSFRSYGLVKRFALAIEGYQNIADATFGASSVEAFHIRRVLRAEFTLKDMLNARSITAQSPDSEDRQHLDRLAAGLYCDRAASSRLPLLAYQMLPVSAYEGLRRFVRRFRRQRPSLQR